MVVTLSVGTQEAYYEFAEQMRRTLIGVCADDNTDESISKRRKIPGKLRSGSALARFLLLIRPSRSSIVSGRAWSNNYSRWAPLPNQIESVR